MKRFSILVVGLLLTVGATMAQLSQTLEDVQYLSSSVAVAVGDGGAIARSVDGGSTWTTIPGFTDDFRGLTFPTSTTGWMIGVVGGSSNIYRSNDGGASWTRLATYGAVLTNMKFADVNNGIAVGNSGVIVRSSDGGSTWNPQTSGTTSFLEGLSYVSSNAVATGQFGTILGTSNGGGSWSAQSSGTTYRLRRASFVSTSTGTVVGYGGNIKRTGDGGASWTGQTSPYGTVDLYAVHFVDANNGWVVGPGGLIIHTSNGSSWASQNSGVANALYGVHFKDASNGLAVGNWGTILRTANGGGSWSVMPITAGSPTAPGAPTLLSPATGALNQPTSLTLSWNASSGASTYRIQVSTSSAFTTTVVDDATPTGTSKLVGPLLNGTTYYWRVNSTNSGGTSAWSATWNFTTAAALVAPTVVTTAANSVTTSGGVLNGTVNPNGNSSTAWFEWGTSSTLATYNSTSSQAAGSGTTPFAVWSQLTGLAASTTYYFRAVGQNSAGTTRDGILSFTTGATAPPPPGAFNLISPANGSLNLTASGTLSWGASANATGYDVYLDGNNPPTTIVSSNQAATSYNYSVANGLLRYWKVVAKNSAGNTTATASPWSFTTIVGAPAAPVLLSPATGSLNQPTSLTLSWNASAGAATYRVQVSTSSTFATTIVDDATVAVTSRAVSSLSNNTTYYWRVSATNLGGTSGWSATWNLTTVALAPTVLTTAATLVTSGGATMNGTVNPNGVSTTAWFEWGTSSTLASYTATASQAMGSGSSAAAVSQALTGLSANTTYYFRVAAQNSGGTQRDGIMSFTTGAVLPTVLTTAASSVTSGGGTMNGTVNPNGNATTAWFEWGTSSTLTTYTATTSQSAGSGTSAVAVSSALTGLAANTTYYFRVAAQNGAGTQRDGILSFTTGAVLPTVVTTAAGSVTSSGATMNGTVNPNGNATTAWFEWGTSSTLTTYTATTSQSAGSGTSAVAITSALTGLAANTIYYYRAAGQNGAGTQRAAIMSFTTGAVLPTVLTTAATSVTSGGATLNGTVNPNGNATTAWFEWGTSSTLATYTSTTSQSAGSGSSAVAVNSAVTGLSPNTTYYFRVAGQNGAGIQRDGILSFTTGAVLPTVLTTAASSVTTGGATMNGTVNPNGNATTAWFEWGTSSTLATFTATTAQSIGSGSSAVGVNAALTGLAASTTYYYRAAGQNSAGTQRDGILNFTTGVAAPPPPGAFNLLTPATGAVNQAVSGTLTWAQSANATSYDVYLDVNNPPTTIVSANQTTLSYSYSGLLTAGAYNWKVVAKNSAGTATSSNSPWSFTTIVLAPTVTTTGATSITQTTVTLNGSVNPNGASTTTWFEWGTSSTLTTYSSTSPIAIGSGRTATGTIAGLTGLTTNQTYYYRAAAQNSGGTTRDGILSFTTPKNPPPPTPSLSSPGNGALGQPTSLNLAWSSSTGATAYHLTVSTTLDFSSGIVYDNAALTSTTQSVGGLSNSVMYYWRVSASNDGGSSANSSAWNFTTLTSPPVFSLDKTSINYGTVAVGKTKVDSVTVTNTGGSNLVISSIQSISTQYTVSPSSGTVPAGSSLKVYITFAPTAKSTINGQINFVHNAAGSPGSVTLTGVGGSSKGGGKRTPLDYIFAGAGSKEMPENYALGQNYPNPFNPTTSITYELPEPSSVQLSVFNLLGQEVTTLIAADENSGAHTVVWNAMTNNNEQLPSGTYIYRLHAKSLTSDKEFEVTRKMILMK